MRLGFNFTLSDTHDLVQRLIAERHIDYCELLIDNFFCVPPADLANTFDCPIGFHIMFSKFLESDTEFLADFAKRLRVYIDALNPVYISDHVARFTFEGKTLFHLGEIDYQGEYDFVKQRVALWQDMIGRQLLLENYPSIMDGGLEAPEFFERLMDETGAGVLFDASNAVCAMNNCKLPLDAWDSIIARNKHFHVAGYRLSMTEPHICLDTHAEELAEDSCAFLAARRALFDKPGATLTYERDSDIDYDSVVADLMRLRKIFVSSQEVCHDVAVPAC